MNHSKIIFKNANPQIYHFIDLKTTKTKIYVYVIKIYMYVCAYKHTQDEKNKTQMVINKHRDRASEQVDYYFIGRCKLFLIFFIPC